MDKLFDFIMGLSGPAPYLFVFLMLFVCGLGVPIPEDITLIAGGLSVHYGVAKNVWLMIFTGLVGVMIGDSLVFFLGAKYGKKLIKKSAFFRRMLPEDRLEKVSHDLRTKGTRLMFFARFMPGLRAPIFFTAGSLHMPFRHFFFWDGLAALISVPAIVYSSYYFGNEIDHVIKIIKGVQHAILALIVVVLVYIVFKIRKKRKSQKASSHVSK